MEAHQLGTTMKTEVQQIIATAMMLAKVNHYAQINWDPGWDPGRDPGWDSGLSILAVIFFVILAEMLAEILSDILAKILGEIFSEIQANVSSKILSNILGYPGCDLSRDLTWKFGVDSNGLLISKGLFSQKTNGKFLHFQVRFSGELKTLKFPFEINWPLPKSWDPKSFCYILGLRFCVLKGNDGSSNNRRPVATTTTENPVLTRLLASQVDTVTDFSTELDIKPYMPLLSGKKHFFFH